MSLLLLLVLNLHWRLEDLTLTLPETVRVEETLEMGLHLLHELLAQEVDVLLLHASTACATTATPTASAATTSRCVVPRTIRNSAHGDYWRQKDSLFKGPFGKCIVHSTPDEGDQQPGSGNGECLKRRPRPPTQITKTKCSEK